MPHTIYWNPADPSGAPAQSTPAIGFSQAAYVRQLMQLLPRGRALNLEADSYVVKTLNAIADEFARIDARGVDLINESDPRSAVETLPDWERMLSLPDDQVTVIPGTTPQRQTAITQKYTAQGGQDLAFFLALAAACGYTLADGTLPAPVISSVVSSGTGGTLAAATYAYKVTAFNYSGNATYPYNGETIASSSSSVVISAGTTNKVTVNWPRVPGADGYRVYGRTGGVFHLIGVVYDTGAGTYAFVDTGAVAPTGSAPVANTATYTAIEKFAARMLRTTRRMTHRFFGVSWAYTMRLNITAISGSALAQAAFEAVIRHHTNAHIYAVIFVYH